MYSRLICLLLITWSTMLSGNKSEFGIFVQKTSCTEFAKHARFNPNSVLEDNWFVFYYWGPDKSLQTVKFSFPTTKEVQNLKTVLDGRVNLKVDWYSRLVLMVDQNNVTRLLVEQNKRGRYLMYTIPKVRDLKSFGKITAHDTIFKQTGDNKIIGFLDCSIDLMVVMSRQKDIPSKSRIFQEAMRLGYYAGPGTSYLEQSEEHSEISKKGYRIDKDKNIKQILINKDEQLIQNKSVTNTDTEENSKKSINIKSKHKMLTKASPDEPKIVFLLNSTNDIYYTISNDTDQSKLKSNPNHLIRKKSTNKITKPEGKEDTNLKPGVEDTQQLKVSNQEELRKVFNNIEDSVIINKDLVINTNETDSELKGQYVITSKSGLSKVDRPFHHYNCL